MKKLIHLIYIIPFLLLASCSQEEAPLPFSNKTVQINLSTRVGNTDAGTNDENAIHSIRVYAFDATSNELVGYHHEASIDATKSYIFQMPLNFSLKEDFTSGTVQAKFYIVVNEEAVNVTLPNVNTDESGIPDGTNTITPSELLDLTFSDYGTNRIQIGVPNEGLPMSCAYENVTLNTETGQVLSFDLHRAVSRIKVQFKNENNSTPIDITTLKFGKFIADKAYLFPREENAIPQGTNYQTQDVSVNISAPFQEISNAVSCYILPSKAGSDQYTFGFNDYDKKELQANENGAYSEITELPRNTSLDITATIKGDYIIFDIPNVNQWSEATGGIIIVD